MTTKEIPTILRNMLSPNGYPLTSKEIVALGYVISMVESMLDEAAKNIPVGKLKWVPWLG